FIVQGMSNIIGSFFSAYPSSGSFNRSGVNYEAGAVTPLAVLFSAPALILIVLAVAPLAAYLPTAAMAGILFLVAWGLIDFHHIGAIARASRAEATVLGVTFTATLVMHLEFAILVGIVLSLLLYLNRTARPRIRSLLPDVADPQRKLVEKKPGHAECPQLKVIRIEGSIYFGAVNHIEEYLQNISERSPVLKHVLLRGKRINFIDVAGAQLLVQEAARWRKRGGGLHLCDLNDAPLKMLGKVACADHSDAIVSFPSTASAFSALIPKLDPEVCAHCTARIFVECSTLPQSKRLIGSGRNGLAIVS
ncbi:MAG: SulP family inorganic anion transporter, partial [Proteobacteria bacterium]|nr:SulP family inorganic anion transporter [Pseudomonadota bacterium]